MSFGTHWDTLGHVSLIYVTLLSFLSIIILPKFCSMNENSEMCPIVSRVTQCSPINPYRLFFPLRRGQKLHKGKW